MGYGYGVYDAPIASFATSSSEVDLSKGWNHVKVAIPTMTSNSTLHVQVGDASGGVYRRVLQHDPASASVSVDMQILSSVTGRVYNCPQLTGVRYMKMEAVNVLSFTAGFKIICSD